MTPQVPGSAPGGAQSYGPRGPADDHLWAMLSYVLGLIFSFVAPLVIFLVKMNESRYVRYHSSQALNMAITGAIYWVAVLILSAILGMITSALALLIFLVGAAYAITAFVFLIMAALAAYRGEMYRVPTVICLPLVH